MATVTRKLTTEDLLAMPDGGVERWLIRGELREKSPEEPGATMTARDRHHCKTTTAIGGELRQWNKSRPKPWGAVYTGEAGVKLKGVSGTTLGVDVVYAPPEVVAVQSDDETTLLDGVPTLCVEIVSPNDTVEQLNEKRSEYLAAGVPLVWVVDPYDRSVRVYRPDAKAVTYEDDETLPEHPAMPGFAPRVADLFE